MRRGLKWSFQQSVLPTEITIESVLFNLQCYGEFFRAKLELKNNQKIAYLPRHFLTNQNTTLSFEKRGVSSEKRWQYSLQIARGGHFSENSDFMDHWSQEKTELILDKESGIEIGTNEGQNSNMRIFWSGERK